MEKSRSPARINNVITKDQFRKLEIKTKLYLL